MRKELSFGVEAGNSIKALVRDLKKCVSVDFVTNYDEILKLKKYRNFEQDWEMVRSKGEDPMEVGVIVGWSREPFENVQFWILPKAFVDKLGNILYKKITELSSEDKVLLMDTSCNDTVDVI